MIALPALSNQRLLIVGGSARAAAFAAVRAGFQPCSYDLFADLDTAQVGPCQAVDDYPAGLPDILEVVPRGPLMYVGGLENSPDVVAHLSESHHVWGVDPATLRRCRAPETLREVLRMAKAPNAEWRSNTEIPPPDGTWMMRPLAGTGGQGIRVWDEQAAVDWSAGVPEAFGFQQRITGVPYSALFIANPEEGDVQFVGVTRQLVGEPALGAAPHVWCGNIGPATLPVSVEQLVRRVGNIFKWKVGLQGIFGLDFLLDADERPWVTEVNPRYPASAEILEWATQNSLLWQHARCFGYEEHAAPLWQAQELPGAFLGKGVVYATRDGEIPPLTEAWAQGVDPWQFPEFGDVPRPASLVRAGQPVCTVYAVAQTEVACLTRLSTQAEIVRSALGL